MLLYVHKVKVHDQDEIANVRDVGMSAALSTHTEIALTEYEVRFSTHHSYMIYPILPGIELPTFLRSYLL